LEKGYLRLGKKENASDFVTAESVGDGAVEHREEKGKASPAEKPKGGTNNVQEENESLGRPPPVSLNKGVYAK